MIPLRDFTSDTQWLSLNTATLGHNLDGFGQGWSSAQVIEACAAQGYGGLVFWQREVQDPVRLGEQVRAAGLRVDGLCRTPYLTGREAGSDDAIKASIDMAAALGAPVLTIVTGGSEPGSRGLKVSQERLAERLAWAAHRAQDQGVKLALEPLNPMFGGNRTCLFTVAEALNICHAVDTPWLGIAVDIYHVWWDSTLATSLAAAQGRIFGFHLCDWLETTRHMLLDRGMMGDGVADIRGIRALVEAAGYQGPCEVEIFSQDTWWQRSPETVLATAKQRFMDLC